MKESGKFLMAEDPEKKDPKGLFFGKNMLLYDQLISCTIFNLHVNQSQLQF